jgi:hypothetical protein
VGQRARGISAAVPEALKQCVLKELPGYALGGRATYAAAAADRATRRDTYATEAEFASIRCAAFLKTGNSNWQANLRWTAAGGDLELNSRIAQSCYELGRQDERAAQPSGGGGGASSGQQQTGGSGNAHSPPTPPTLDAAWGSPGPGPGSSTGGGSAFSPGAGASQGRSQGSAKARRRSHGPAAGLGDSQAGVRWGAVKYVFPSHRPRCCVQGCMSRKRSR